MGEIARTLVSLSGPDAVHGVIPKALIKYEQAGRPVAGETPPVQQQTIKPQQQQQQQQQQAVAPPPQIPDQYIFGRTTVVSSMHERKQLMTQMVLAGGPGSGFIALPGGYGTLEELAEVTTWNQLGIHGAGIVLFDVEGFWSGLVGWMDHATAQGFVGEKNRGIVQCAADAEGWLRELREYRLSSARFDLDWEEK